MAGAIFGRTLSRRDAQGGKEGFRIPVFRSCATTTLAPLPLLQSSQYQPFTTPASPWHVENHLKLGKRLPSSFVALGELFAAARDVFAA